MPPATGCGYLRAADREDAVQEAVAQAFMAYVVLMRYGRRDQIFATVLPRHAIGRVRQGRRLGTPQNSRNALSRVAQRRRGFRVERLDSHGTDDGNWRAALVEDLRTPVPEQAAFWVDYPAWLSRLSSRIRRIAESLANGHSTQAVARKFRLSPGRISQLRRELHDSWEEFHEGLDATAASDGGQQVPPGVGRKKEQRMLRKIAATGPTCVSVSVWWSIRIRTKRSRLISSRRVRIGLHILISMQPLRVWVAVIQAAAENVLRSEYASSVPKYGPPLNRTADLHAIKHLEYALEAV